MPKRREPAPIPVDEVLLTTTDLALMLRRSPDTVRQWRFEERGPAYFRDPTSGGVWYRRSDVEAWLNALRVEPANAE